MPLPLIFALAFLQQPTTARPVAAPQPQVQAGDAPTAMTGTYDVAEKTRLAMTPKIDGHIDDEEWDPIGPVGTSGKAYFQWEPGKLHFGGTVTDGRDLLASFDLHSNGWLIGADNIEARVAMQNGRPTITARLLDATRVTGPTWVDLPGLDLASKVAATSQGGLTTYEVTLADPGMGILPVANGDEISIRFDAPLSTEAPFVAFLPRVLTPVKFALQRAAALPSGLAWNVEGQGKGVTPGESIRLRFTFNGNNNMHFTKLAFVTEGSAKDLTNRLETPFPQFDSRGRAFIDYDTSVAAGAELGYRVVKATLTSADGVSSVMEASFRVAPPADIEFVRQAVPVKGIDRSIRIAYYVRSNTAKRLMGTVSLAVPSPLRVVNADQNKIDLSSHQGQRQTFELYVPANTAGTFPVSVSSDLNGQKITETRFVTIGGL